MSESAPGKRRWPWGTFLVFTLAGPLISLAVFLLALWIWTTISGSGGGDAKIWNSLLFLAIGVSALLKAPLCIVPAAATGVVAGFLQRNDVGSLIYCAACALTGAATSWAVFEFLWPVEALGLIPVAGAAAALNCALITRRRDARVDA